MKFSLLILVCFPFLLTAQSFSLLEKPPTFSTDALRKSSPAVQDSFIQFQNAALPELKSAGSALQNSMWSQFGANILGYLVPLTGYKTVTTTKTITEDDFFGGTYQYQIREEETKLSASGYVFNIGSTALSLFSIYSTGQAGSRLQLFSNQLSHNDSYQLSEAGSNLKSFRTLSYVSSGLGLASGFLLGSSINTIDSDADDVAYGKLAAAGGTVLAGLILKIIAVNKVGKAGKQVEGFSQRVKKDWQKYYFAKSAKNLKKYKKRWNNGLGLIIGGIGIAVTGALLDTQSDAASGVTLASVIGGGVMVISGHILMNWAAPASLGSAGSNLKKFEKLMQQSDN